MEESFAFACYYATLTDYRLCCTFKLQSDEIVVMDGGRVVEQGSHDELMRLGGRYSKLVTFQRSDSSSGDEGEEGHVLLGTDEEKVWVA